MSKKNENLNCFVPICALSGNIMALLHIEKMRQQEIPVIYHTEKQTLYTDTEENAQKARYLLFTQAQVQ